MQALFRKLILILGDCGCIYFATLFGIFVEDTVMGGWVEPRLEYHMKFLPLMLTTTPYFLPFASIVYI